MVVSNSAISSFSRMNSPVGSLVTTVPCSIPFNNCLRRACVRSRLMTSYLIAAARYCCRVSRIRIVSRIFHILKKTSWTASSASWEPSVCEATTYSRSQYRLYRSVNAASSPLRRSLSNSPSEYEILSANQVQLSIEFSNYMHNFPNIGKKSKITPNICNII
jgi:hypothetical protein